MHTSLLKILLFCLLFVSAGYAQDAKQMHEAAKAFMKQGDFQNAILQLNKALEVAPNDITLSNDLALSYYLHSEYNKAIEIIKPVIEGDDATDESFQVAGHIYKSLKQPKEAENIYKKGLKKFQKSGALYNDLGEIMWDQKEDNAIEEWEKGIEKDPAYSKNYYNAAKYYFFTKNKVWSILFGEIFLNLEPYGNKSPEIKDLLLESYKTLFVVISGEKAKDYTRFETVFLQTINKQLSIAVSGINPESLTMIRTRFILDWFNENKRPANKLFDYQKQLLEEGLFEAYNQWIFGSAQNLSSFQNWINEHPDDYAALIAFQKNNFFKKPLAEN